MSNKAHLFDIDFEWPKIDKVKVRKEQRRRAGNWMRENNIDLLLINEPDTVHGLMGQPVLKFYDILLASYFLVDADFNGIVVNPYNATMENPFNYPGMEGVKTVFSAGTNAFYPHLAAEHLAREIKKRGAKRVGIDRPLAEVLVGIQHSLPEVEFVGVGWELRHLRGVKMAEEIAEVEIGAKITAVGHAKAMEQVSLGVTDGQLSGIFAHYGLAHGSMYPSNLYNLHDTNIESWGIKGKPMREGDVVTIDYGLYTPMGLQTDMGRTVWSKGVDPSFKDKYINYTHIVLDVCENQIKPGMTRREVANAFSTAYRGEGLNDELFMLGHGIGYRISEPPVLDVSPVGLEAGEESVIETGQVICFEPAILENNHGKPTIMQSEDMWLVEKNGLRKLSVGCGYMGIDY